MVRREITWSRLIFWVVVCMLLPGCGWLLGCAGTTEKNQAPVETCCPEGELAIWADAVKSFWSQDYQKALDSFTVIEKTSVSEEMRLRALYAKASTELILARTDEEFREATADWERWAKQPKSGSTGEDPRMLTPVLERLAPAVPAEAPESHAHVSPSKTHKTNAPLLTTLNSCKSLLQAREKEVERLKSRLDSRDKELRRLKHQIESLEEIHLKYQERKQEVSTP